MHPNGSGCAPTFYYVPCNVSCIDISKMSSYLKTMLSAGPCTNKWWVPLSNFYIHMPFLSKWPIFFLVYYWEIRSLTGMVSPGLFHKTHTHNLQRDETTNLLSLNCQRRIFYINLPVLPSTVSSKQRLQKAVWFRAAVSSSQRRVLSNFLRLSPADCPCSSGRAVCFLVTRL